MQRNLIQSNKEQAPRPLLGGDIYSPILATENPALRAAARQDSTTRPQWPGPLECCSLLHVRKSSPLTVGNESASFGHSSAFPFF